MKIGKPIGTPYDVNSKLLIFSDKEDKNIVTFLSWLSTKSFDNKKFYWQVFFYTNMSTYRWKYTSVLEDHE